MCVCVIYVYVYMYVYIQTLVNETKKLSGMDQQNLQLGLSWGGGGVHGWWCFCLKKKNEGYFR